MGGAGGGVVRPMCNAPQYNNNRATREISPPAFPGEACWQEWGGQKSVNPNLHNFFTSPPPPLSPTSILCLHFSCLHTRLFTYSTYPSLLERKAERRKGKVKRNFPPSLPPPINKKAKNGWIGRQFVTCTVPTAFAVGLVVYRKADFATLGYYRSYPCIQKSQSTNIHSFHGIGFEPRTIYLFTKLLHTTRVQYSAARVG